ncbi:MAG: CHAT domain-containing protein, partial [Deltaproteobacteria bacterium]|nr:CHAT domain-containing protein [Deltaproteobacteria bacterium]
WLLARPLQGVSTDKRLLLVTHGALAAVPYAALTSQGKALVATRTVAHITSLASFVRKQRAGAAQQSKARGQWASFSHAADTTAPLPFAARESFALGRTMSRVMVYQQERATRASLLDALSQPLNVHLATHFRFEGDDPLASEFSLHDGALALSTVLTHKVRAPLVVLSTCNGGAGVPGAALHDLPRAFIGAGAGRVVASLWRISDLGTALLAKYLFRQLAAGKAPAMALHDAQRELARRHAHPAFWAGLRVYLR